MRYVDDIPVCGEVDENAIAQMQAVRPTVEYAAIMGDGHLGSVVPIGGVVASQEMVSLHAVGVDVCCGNKAVRLDIDPNIVRRDIVKIMDEIASQISFGMGRASGWDLDHELFESPLWNEIPALQQRTKHSDLKTIAKEQLGTVGGGNHYVDILIDEQDRVWAANHFGSRGFGNKTATWFMNEAGAADGTHADHVTLHYRSDLGEQYLKCYDLISTYAYAGRDAVLDRVVKIIGAKVMDSIHLNHNGVWRETHNGIDYFVGRKGSTPAWPGSRCFVGGSMGDESVILEGVDTPMARELFYSTVHGAGRVMSRTAATGRSRYDKKGNRQREPGIKKDEMMSWIGKMGVELRGSDVDEAPQAYKRLHEVLPGQGDTIKVLHRLRPIGVAMSPSDLFDPYKD